MLMLGCDWPPADWFNICCKKFAKELLVAVSAFVADVTFVEVALLVVVDVVARKYFSNCRKTHTYKKKFVILILFTGLIRLILSVHCGCRRHTCCLRWCCHSGRGIGRSTWRAIHMMRVAWKIRIEIKTKPNTHAKTHWMSMMMEYVRPWCTSSLCSSSRMSTAITSIYFKII